MASLQTFDRASQTPPRSGVEARLLALQIETAGIHNPTFRQRLENELGVFRLEMLRAQNGS